VKAMRGVPGKPIESSPLSLQDLPDPSPAAGEIVVRVRACAVCHTDLHVVEGDLAPHRSPIVPGHQAVGVVEAVGAGVSSWRAGDRVGVPWLHWACGACRFCRRGAENLCERGRFTGWDVDGGFAERLVARADFALPIPPAFSDVEAAPLLCAGIVGFRALRLSGAARGARLGLYGFGASAHVTLQVARHLGCEVDVFTRSESHRALARSLGAAWTGGSGDRPPAPLDAAILFAPAGALVHDALRALDPGGTLVLAGIHMSPVPETPYELLWGERVVRSVANATREDGRELLRLAAEIPVRTEVETFPLADANRALQDVKASRVRGAAVLVFGK
jgi:alcohol dehydrogenase, propanol-preferring